MMSNSKVNILLKASMVGGIFAILSVFIFSLFMYFFDFPVSVQNGGLYILLNISIFLSGIYAGKKSSKKGYLYGLIASLVLILIILLLSVIILKGNIDFLDFIIKMPVLVLVGVIGGVFGANLRK